MAKALTTALCALLLAPGPFGGPALAQELSLGVAAALAEPGLYCAALDTDRRAAPGTISGWIHLPRDPVRRIADGQVAPAALGMGFGVRYRLAAGVAGGVVEFSVTHPPIPPSGTTAQRWSGHVSPNETDTIFFQFDHPEELVLGRWTISAEIDGKALFTAAFDIVPPDQRPEVLGLCQGPDMLSLSPSRRDAAG